MKIIILQRADDDLDRIFSWIEKDSPRAAVSVIRRIREKIGLSPRASPIWDGLVAMRAPASLSKHRNIVVYEVHEERDEIIVLAVFHGAQDRRGGLD
jgi:toxin ParE1/3/4